MEDNAFSLKNGTLVCGDRYRIDSLIGAGGFGITYKAFDQSTSTLCAIKEYVPLGLCSRMPDGTLIPMAGEKEDYYIHGKLRFMEEAQCLMALSDVPNIVRVRECFEERGTAYYVMEYLKGCDIKHLMRRMPGGKFCVDDAVNIIEIAADSLEQIHRTKKMLHRDISPDNIFFCDDGAVYLIDFGSAKHICQQKEQNFSVVLKPGFAPIEQYSRKVAQGPYTDIYALAGTLYYMLTGTMVPAATDRVNGKGYVPAWQVSSDIPKSLSDTIDRALELDYKLRIQTAIEFVDGITQYRYETENNVQESGITESKMAVSEMKGLEMAGPAFNPDIDPIQHSELHNGGMEIGGIEGVKIQDVGIQEIAAASDTEDGSEEEPVKGGFFSRSKAHKRERKLNTIRGISNNIVARKPKPYVEIANSEFSGKRWMLPVQTELIIGRSSAVSNLVVPSFAAISKEHCHIMFDEKEDCFFVQDVSSNGTATEQYICPKNQWIPIKNQHFIILAAVCCLKIGVEYE